jgi:hypothetical protein
LVQFGADWESRGAPSAAIRRVAILDDKKTPEQIANGMQLKRGQLSFAGGGPNTRTSSIFFVKKSIPSLGIETWEVPFAEVVGSGMTVVDSFYSGYGDFAIFGGHAPDLGKYWYEGPRYLDTNFPKLDKMLKCSILASSKHSDDVRAEVPGAFISRHTWDGHPSSELKPETGSLLSLLFVVFGSFILIFWLATRVATLCRPSDAARGTAAARQSANFVRSGGVGAGKLA